MLQSLVDFPKQLPRTLVCLGIGALNLFVWHKLQSASSPPNGSVVPDPFSSDPIVNSFVEGAVFFIFAYSIGTFAIYLGNLIAERREKEDDRVLREIYLFETGNVLLVQRYQDAILRSELVFGLFASIFINLLLVTMLSITVAKSQPTTSTSWYQIVGGIIFLVISFVLSFAARAPLEAIDRVLKERYPEIVAKRTIP